MADPGGTSEASLVERLRALADGGGAQPGRGPMRLTPFWLVVAVAFVGSGAFITYAIVIVRDSSQIPMLSAGFAVLGIATAAIALAAVIGLWRAADDGRNGRALALAILGGVVGLGAIGCFTLTVVLALLWKSAS
jgi:chromate transport protein ChrA